MMNLTTTIRVHASARRIADINPNEKIMKKVKELLSDKEHYICGSGVYRSYAEDVPQVGAFIVAQLALYVEYMALDRAQHYIFEDSRDMVDMTQPRWEQLRRYFRNNRNIQFGFENITIPMTAYSSGEFHIRREDIIYCVKDIKFLYRAFEKYHDNYITE